MLYIDAGSKVVEVFGVSSPREISLNLISHFMQAYVQSAVITTYRALVYPLPKKRVELSNYTEKSCILEEIELFSLCIQLLPILTPSLLQSHLTYLILMKSAV